MGGLPVNGASSGEAMDSELDLPGLWSAIARKKKFIAGAVLACLAAAAVFLAVVKPRYAGEAKVLVENQESYFTRPEKAGNDQQLAPDLEAVASQVQVFTSRDLAREAITRLNLKGNPEYDPLAAGEGMLSRAAALLGIAKTRRHLSAEDRIQEKFNEKLAVIALAKSRVISVEFSSRDPDLAAHGANTIVDIYLDLQSKSKKERASLAANSIGTVVADLRAKLADAEARVEAFRASSGLLQGSNNNTIPTQQLGELSGQLASARNSMAEAQAKARNIRSSLQRGRLDEISDIAKDELVRRLGEQRAGLRSRIAFEARTLGPSHPRLQELSAQLASAEVELRATAERAARALEGDARVASSRVDNILAAIESEKRRVGGSGADLARLREYELEAKLYREQLEVNTTKYREALARQQAESTPSDARIISRAIVPERAAFPKAPLILAFAFIGGLLFSVGGVVASELLSGRALRPAMAPGYAYPMPDAAGRAMGGAGDANEFGQSQTAEPDRPRPVGVSAGDHGLAHSSASLAKLLLAEGKRESAARILLCSASPRADAAKGAEPFARVLAASATAILIDFGGRILDGAPGLSDLLTGEASFADAIEPDTRSRLHLIGRGTGHIEPGEDLDAVIGALSTAYEYVLLLAPADDPGSRAAAALAAAVDFAVIVASGREAPGALTQTSEILRAAGAGEIAILASASSSLPDNDVAPATVAA